MGEIAEVVAAGVAVAFLMAASWKCMSSIFVRLSAHEIRLDTGEVAQSETTRSLERTALIVARLEERTKNV